MKRLKKNEMLETVSILEKVNDAIVKNTGRSVRSNAIDALAQCQESALFLGNHLETLGGKAAFLVRILEDYCENIYQISLVLSDHIQCRKISKKIQKQLTQLSYGIRYELPDDRKEIVFFPYKASMWDCLETVWRAADEDENCVAYVVPIPYFAKNRDGTLGQLHYEGDQYPEYVPVTSWKEYSLEESRPDIVYIHNPYDECNYVTSVHPAFYAKELKKYTEMLVYIPYFVGINGRVDKHFCVLPGTMYADRVILQSEEIRKIYIDEYQRFEKNNHCEDRFGKAEEKFCALGSPKFDKVLNLGREDIEIPAGWLQILKKADGSMKKIIFYNTSISTLLEKKERMLQKMQDVFYIFQEHKETAVLLWRPHPLIEETIKTMLPQLWLEYKKIVDRYRREAWGIYDDTADMSRAIALSDAYYGDMSSIVELYHLTGKPVMIQNVEI